MDESKFEDIVRSRDYRYDLSDDDMHEKVVDLLNNHPPVNGSEIVCYLVDDNDVANVARSVERQVFEKAFDNDASEMTKIYGPYEGASLFFLSVDTTTQRPCGALRVIENSDNGLMTLNDLPTGATDRSIEEILMSHQVDSLNDCWDVGTVAVLAQYRKYDNFAVSTQLYRALYVSAMKKNIKHFFSIIDDKPFKMMTDYLGIPFKSLQGSVPFEFEGSKLSHAVHGYVPDFYKSMNRRRYTTRGWLARHALRPLVKGSKDNSLMFDTNY